MSEPEAPISRQTFLRLAKSIAQFLRSPSGKTARWLLVALMLLMLGINAMNVANSYVGRYFMSSIERREWAGFTYFAWLYIAVFAGSTLTGVFFRFTEERLGLLWRDWLTHLITSRYIDNRLYIKMSGEGAVSNPDQRMTEDVRQLTTTTLSFLLMILNGTIAAISFSGVLWAISPKLFGVAVLYALAGSALTIWLGRPLIRLNYTQADREANFRSALIQTRANADGIALSGKEADIRERLMSRIDSLVENLRRIIAVNRNLSFFTTGYNYMIQLIPVLIVAPLFMQGDVEFGVIGQSTMAFATLLGAFSLVITQFQAISSYASVVSRLGEFVEAAEKLTTRKELARIGISSDSDHFEFTDLTLIPPEDNALALIRGLNVTWLAGQRVMVHGANRSGRIALFRAVAGIHESGTGSILRPSFDQVMFLPERPFLPSCQLRELLMPDHPTGTISDDQICQTLSGLGIDAATKGPAGIDETRNWQEALSFRDAKLMGVARVLLAKPQFVLVDELESSLDEAGRTLVFDLFEKYQITCVSFGGQDPPPTYQGASLELLEDGSWKWQKV